MVGSVPGWTGSGKVTGIQHFFMLGHRHVYVLIELILSLVQKKNFKPGGDKRYGTSSSITQVPNTSHSQEEITHTAYAQKKAYAVHYAIDDELFSLSCSLLEGDGNCHCMR